MVVERFYPHVGGSETQALNLSGELQKMGVELFVLTRRTLKDMAPREEVSGIKVFRVLPTGTGKMSLLGASFSFAYFLFKHHREYDIIHCHGMGWAGPVSSLVGSVLGKKTFVKVATAGDVTGNIVGKKKLSGLINGIRLFLLRFSDKVICISHEIADELTKKGLSKEKLIFIPNGVDIYRFMPGDGTKKLFDNGKLNIIFSGRIVYRKGIDILLKAFKDIVKDYHNIHLNILGSGKLQMGDEYEDELKSFVAKNDIEGSVTFHGDVDNVEDYLKEADLFAFPSRHEGLPNALLEAMACGLPIVATSIGGVVDVVKDGKNGILVRPDDADAIYKAIMRLIESPDLRGSLGIAARKTVENEYSLETTAEKYIALYRGLI